MMLARQVLLLSARPEAHAAFMGHLRARGLRVSAPRTRGAARRSLEAPADLVLVDLVYGPGLDERMVESINRRQGHSLVVALHEGNLERFEVALSRLSVDGYCRAGEWQSIATASISEHRSFALH